MKILSIGNFTNGWDTSICDEEHIAESLEELGYEVERWQREDVAFGSAPQDDFDFVLLAQWSEYPKDFVMTLKRLTGAPVVYWAFDYQSLPRQEWHEELAAQADIFLSKEMDNREDYQKLGANFHWLPQDFAPSFLKYRPAKEIDTDILFTGTYLPHAVERNKLLKTLDEKYNLRIHSITPVDWKHAGFKNVHDVVVDQDLPKLVSRAKINISIDHTLKEGYWSDRNAQIMCCGGYTLFRYVPMSELVFGSYIDYFHSEQEMLEKVDRALSDDSHRNLKAQRGRKYARGNLLVKNRVQQMLEIVKAYENSSL